MSLEIEKIDLSGVVASGGELSSRFEDASLELSHLGERSLQPTPMSSLSAGTGLGLLLSSHGSWTVDTRDDPTLESDEPGRLFRRSQVCQALEESAKVLMRRQKYEESVTLLEGVVPMTYRQQLLLAECYFYTGQPSEAKIAVGHAERLMTSSLKLRKHQITKAVKTAIANSSYVRALILLHCSPRYAFLKFVPDEAVMYIDRAVSDYAHVIKAMVEYGGQIRDIAVWFVKEMMLDILLLFREISGSSYRRKVQTEPRILTYFGLIYRAIGDHTKSLECFQQGLEILVMNLDDRAETTRSFGTLLHNAGLAYETLGEYAEAEDHYSRAIDAFEKAEDWDSYRKKYDSVKTTKTNLKLLREKLESLGPLSEVSGQHSLDSNQVEPPQDVYAPTNLAEEANEEN